MARWTTQQALGAAPDDRVARAARALARPGPWSNLGSTEALVWGECQGSGSTPYRVTVELTEPAFRCTCPSRKQPCKHGVALLLLWVEGEGSVAELDDAPTFATELAGRPSGRRRSDGQDKAAVDPEAQARRLAQRRALMTAGLEDFERWMTDLVRRGLAEARHERYSFWDRAAARLVDAQLPGLAERVREMPSQLHGRTDWADHLLAQLGSWYLAVRAWHRWDDLDDAARGDLRVVLGWTISGDEVMAGEHVRDRWLVAGVHRTDDGRLQSQRTWLHGRGSGRWVLLLDFAVTGAILRVPQTTGAVLEAEVALYPGTAPRRARFMGDPVAVATDRLPVTGAGDIEAAFADLADTIAGNPWVARIPVWLPGVSVGATTDGAGVLTDGGGTRLALAADTQPWTLLALTGGHPAAVFGELEYGRFRPLAVDQDGLVPL